MLALSRSIYCPARLPLESALLVPSMHSRLRNVHYLYNASVAAKCICPDRRFGSLSFPEWDASVLLPHRLSRVRPVAICMVSRLVRLPRFSGLCGRSLQFPAFSLYSSDWSSSCSYFTVYPVYNCLSGIIRRFISISFPICDSVHHSLLLYPARK